VVFCLVPTGTGLTPQELGSALNVKLLWNEQVKKQMTPEVARILVDGLMIIVFIGGVMLCFYAALKGFFGGYHR